MRRTLLIRLGGLAAMVGGTLCASLALPWPFYSETVFLVFLVLGALAAIVAIAALLVPEGQHWRMLVAPLMAFVGVVLLLVGILAEHPALPVFPGADLLFFVGLIGLLVGILGLLALGIQVIVLRVLPWWGGIALIAGNPLSLIIEYGLLNSLLWMVWPTDRGPPSQFSPDEIPYLVWAVPWIVVGFAIFRAAARQTQQAPRVR